VNRDGFELENGGKIVELQDVEMDGQEFMVFWGAVDNSDSNS